MIDSYVHIGLPRFQSVEDCEMVMQASGIEKAIVCPFETCPDIASVHRAIQSSPGRFRGAGIPLGKSRQEMTEGVRAQLDAGFAGLRLSDADVVERGFLLEELGRRDAFALVCGRDGLQASARSLLAYLARFENGLVIAGHCAGPTLLSVLDDSAVAELYAHERFVIVLSRQGLFPEPMVSEWVGAVIERVGWTRVLWGSESPVLHWRDESIDTAKSWIERFSPSPEDHEGFFARNAERLVFDRPIGSPGPLQLPYDPWAYEVPRPSPMWPFGLDLDTRLSARLVHGWLQWGGGTRGPLRGYLEEILDGAMPDNES